MATPREFSEPGMQNSHTGHFGQARNMPNPFTTDVVRCLSEKKGKIAFRPTGAFPVTRDDIEPFREEVPMSILRHRCRCGHATASTRWPWARGCPGPGDPAETGPHRPRQGLEEIPDPRGPRA